MAAKAVDVVQSPMSASQRRFAAAKYRPSRVRLLLVAEAPPCSPDRYFYFEDVERHDGLFRYVWEGMTGVKPERTRKREYLHGLRDAGAFMIDLHEESISKPSLSDLKPMVPGLLARCREIGPQHIVLIKASVYDAAFEQLTLAGLPVINQRIPFPSRGQQNKFLAAFRKAIGAAEKSLEVPR